MRFERYYEVINTKLENMCVERDIYDEHTIFRTIHGFDIFRNYFIDSNIHSYDEEGIDLFDYNTVVSLFDLYLDGENLEEFLNNRDSNMKPQLSLEEQMFDILDTNDDNYRTNEKLVSLFSEMVLNKANRYGIEIQSNCIGTKLYNKSSVMELFNHFIKRIKDYEIDINEIY